MIRRWLALPLFLLASAGCAEPAAMVQGPGGQASIPIVVTGGTPVALSPARTPTTAVAVVVRTPVPQATPRAPEQLAQKMVPMTAAPSATRPPPAEPAERELWTFERAEADLEAGRHREALDRLDAGPLPADVLDLATVRRADLGLTLGDRARAEAELASPALADTTNRMILVLAAETAEKAGLWREAGAFWTRAAREPTWYAERMNMLRSAAQAYARAGDVLKAAEGLSQLADNLGRNPDPELVASLKANDELTAYHVGLMALAQGNHAEAAQRFRRYLTVAPGGPYAEPARNRLNRLSASGPSGPNPWNAAREADSVEAYAAFRRANPSHSQAAEALYRQGLAHYRAGQLDAALELWLSAAAPTTSAENRARALYWIGKVFAEQGQAEAAREKWAMAAAVRPSSYYSVRAGDRLASGPGWPSGGVVLPSSRVQGDEDAEARAWIERWAPKSGPTADEQGAIDRAAKFAKLGFTRTAGAELDSLIESTPNARAVYEAGRRALEDGLWLSSVRAGLRLARMSPEKVPLDVPRAVRRMAYPAGYADLVQVESARAELGPLLMLSLIRQESLFDRYARSTADARGLTQVMPATGAELARVSGRSGFTADDLFDPNTSVNFGARFLIGQIVGFRGDIFRAVAAYNAGAGGANKWARGVDDPDVYVEMIGYRETREYVKAIYIHHAAYRSLVAP